MGGTGRFTRSRAGDLRIAHRSDLAADHVLRAIDAHRANAARGREFCEHWGPASSVSRIVLRRAQGDLDLAVKWNHPRGLRAALSEGWTGSRAVRARAGAERLAGLAVDHPPIWAVVERRRPGRVLESFLLTGYCAGSLPLPARMPELLASPRRRRSVAHEIGRVLGTLHGAGLDHRDLKHSNWLVGGDDRVVLLDLDALVALRRLPWRARVRALGQLEAYASDLYPELPRSDRARVLRAYLAHAPELRARRRALVGDVRAWVERRLAHWRGRDRALHVYYPMAPRPPLAPTPVDLRETSVEGERCA